MWINNINISLIFIVLSGLENDVSHPCCVDAYIFKEYAADRKLTSIRGIIEQLDEATIVVINIISLKRLIDGGAAIFHAVNKNHHIVSMGAVDNRPFVKYMLRV